MTRSFDLSVGLENRFTFRRRVRVAFCAAHVVGALAIATSACSVYDDPGVDPAGSGGSNAGSAGAGGAAGRGGSAGGGASGSSGAAGSHDASVSDAPRSDADAMLSDRVDTSTPPSDAMADAGRDGGTSDATSDGADALPPDDDVAIDVEPPDDAGGSDVFDSPPTSDVVDTGSPPIDARDADADIFDAGADRVDVIDSGPTGPQVLPPHGSPIEKPDAGGPFHSRCASDEVITGFVGRAGAQTDAIASTCSRLVGGVLSSPRNLPLNGNTTGGSAFSVQCPANYVAIGIVGRYGHSTMWNEDITTMIGVVCKNLGSTATQIVTITGQPTLDAGYVSFREDCTNGRYLTDISGRTDTNSLGYCVQQVGGECDVR
ncbi:MAG: hypothetical protein ABW133_12725 [Polyangiaceae bacterium]